MPNATPLSPRRKWYDESLRNGGSLWWDDEAQCFVIPDFSVAALLLAVRSVEGREMVKLERALNHNLWYVVARASPCLHIQRHAAPRHVASRRTAPHRRARGCTVRRVKPGMDGRTAWRVSHEAVSSPEDFLSLHPVRRERVRPHTRSPSNHSLPLFEATR